MDTFVTSFKSTAEYIRVEAKLITGIHYECVENRFVKVSASLEQGVVVTNPTFPSLSTTTTTIYFRARPGHVETPTEHLLDDEARRGGLRPARPADWVQLLSREG